MSRTTRYAYDDNNRLVSRSYPNPAENVSFTYTATGRRETATDARGTTRYGYDLRDRLTSLEQPGFGTGTARLGFAYDGNGNRLALTATVGGQSFGTGYTYDDAGRLDVVTDPAGRAYDHGYDANGNRASLAQPNGAVTAYTYDNLNRLTNLATTIASLSRTVQTYAFTLGPAGNRTRIVEAAGLPQQRTLDYSYDALYRLTGETVYRIARPRLQQDLRLRPRRQPPDADDRHRPCRFRGTEPAAGDDRLRLRHPRSPAERAAGCRSGHGLRLGRERQPHHEGRRGDLHLGRREPAAPRAEGGRHARRLPLRRGRHSRPDPDDEARPADGDGRLPCRHVRILEPGRRRRRFVSGNSSTPCPVRARRRPAVRHAPARRGPGFGLGLADPLLPRRRHRLDPPPDRRVRHHHRRLHVHGLRRAPLPHRHRPPAVRLHRRAARSELGLAVPPGAVAGSAVGRGSLRDGSSWSGSSSSQRTCTSTCTLRRTRSTSSTRRASSLYQRSFPLLRERSLWRWPTLVHRSRTFLSRGGPVLGEFFQEIGAYAQATGFQSNLSTIRALRPGLQVLPDQLARTRVIDAVLKLGDKTAWLEMKYGLPWSNAGGIRCGRLVDQVEDRLVATGRGSRS